jgi:hypothetical protein
VTVTYLYLSVLEADVFVPVMANKPFSRHFVWRLLEPGDTSPEEAVVLFSFNILSNLYG